LDVNEADDDKGVKQAAILFTQKDATIDGGGGVRMKTGDILEKLMEFIYNQYSRSDTFKSHGEYASIMLTRFTRESGIRLGNAGAQLEFARQLLKKGWIEIVALDGSTRIGARLFTYSRIKPTPEGIEHVEQRRQPGQAVLKIASTAAEIIGRGVKGFLGK